MADAVMSGGGFGFLLPATAYEPEDVAFSLASPAIRNRFHAEAGRVAARVWDASRAKGLDRLGRPLAPIAPATVEARRRNRNPVTGQKPYSPMGRASATAPPLTPVGLSSRTRAYLRHRTAPGRGVWFWHKFDSHTRHYWGEILARHGRGFVQRFRSGFRFVPPRDVLGFSDAELAAIRDHMGRWWAARQPKPVTPIRIEAPRPQRQPGEPRRPKPSPDPFRRPTPRYFERVSDDGVFTRGAGVSMGDAAGGRVILESGRFQYVYRPGQPEPPRPPAAAMPVRPRLARVPKVTPPPIGVPTRATATPPAVVAAAIRSRGIPVNGDTIERIAEMMTAIDDGKLTLPDVRRLIREAPDRRTGLLWRLAWELIALGMKAWGLTG